MQIALSVYDDLAHHNGLRKARLVQEGNGIRHLRRSDLRRATEQADWQAEQERIVAERQELDDFRAHAENLEQWVLLRDLESRRTAV